jgi:tetratricopeptide (TPR) repeat protein
LKLPRKISLVFILLLPLFSLAQLNIEHFMKKGIAELRSENYTEAIRTFNVLIRARPDMAEPHIYRGRAKLVLGDLKGAEYDFTRAVMLDAYNPDAYYYRGVVRSNLFDYYNALDDFKKSLERRPNNPNVLFSRGTTKIRMEDYQGAINDFDTLILLRPDIEQAFLNRSIAKAKIEDYKGAIEDCNKAIRKNIFYVEAFIQRGLLHKETEQFDAAIADFDQAIKIDEKNPLTHFYKAAASILVGDTANAITGFDKVIQLDPFNDLTFYNRGLIKAEQGNFDDALSDFENVLKINPRNVYTWYNKGIVNLRTENFEAAKRDFTEAIRLFPDFAAAYMNRAQARQQLDDRKGANEDYELAIAIINAVNEGEDFGFINAYYSADSTYLKNIIEFETDFNAYNPEDGRIQHQRVLIELQPNFMIQFYAASKVAANEKKTGYFYPPLSDFKYNSDQFALGISSQEVQLSGSEARIISDKVDSIMYFNPFDAENYFVKGIFNWNRMNYGEAITAFDRAIELIPDYAEAYFNRANVLFELIEHQYTLEQTTQPIVLTQDGAVKSEEASDQELPDFGPVLEDYDRVIAIDPKMSFAWYNRANIKNRMRDFEGAIQDYTVATSLNPDFAEAFYNRALTLIYLNRNRDACYDLSKAGELGIAEAYNVIKRYCSK